MIKNIASILNELTERGLVKEAEYLYEVFTKVAYESAQRAEALFNRANPKKNPEANERRVAADRLIDLIQNTDRPEFGYKELAKIILEQGEQGAFDSQGFLGSALSASEVNVLKALMNRGGARDDGFRPYQGSSEGGSGEQAWERQDGDRHREQEARGPSNHERVVSILGKITHKLIKVNIKRTRGSSEAYVWSMNGELVTFIVPAANKVLGYKILTVTDLDPDEFLRLNPGLERKLGLYGV